MEYDAAKRDFEIKFWENVRPFTVIFWMYSGISGKTKKIYMLQ